MSRLLLVSPPWEGHINPATGIAAVARKLGHEVAWVGDGPLFRKLGVVDRMFETFPSFVTPDRPPGMRGIAALDHLWSKCITPLAMHMDDTVVRAIDAFKPDAVIVDQQAVGAALRTYDCGLPWLTLACSPAELGTRLGAHASILDWTTGAMHHLAGAMGLGRCPDDALFAPLGTLMPSAPALMGPIPDHVRVRPLGCLVRHRMAFATPQRDARNKPHILVSLGTVSGDAGGRFLESAWAAATSCVDMHWTIVDPAGSLGRRHASNVTLATRVDQLTLLTQVSAVLCHGGHNTVAESLLHGCPLVVAPIRDDQPVIAQHVVDAGAGLRLRFAHAAAGHVVDAVHRVVEEPCFRNNALRIGGELANGEQRAGELLASWLRDPTLPIA